MQDHQHHPHYRSPASYLPVELLQRLTTWRCRNQMGLGRKARNQLECSCQPAAAVDTEGVDTLETNSLAVSIVDQRNVCIVHNLYYVCNTEWHLFPPSCLSLFCRLPTSSVRGVLALYLHTESCSMPRVTTSVSKAT